MIVACKAGSVVWSWVSHRFQWLNEVLPLSNPLFKKGGNTELDGPYHLESSLSEKPKKAHGNTKEEAVPLLGGLPCRGDAPPH